jgi:hypothetical protein
MQRLFILYHVPRVSFACVSRAVCVLFARVALAVAVLFVRIVHVLISCCRVSFARVTRAVRTRRHTSFACVACSTYKCRSPCRASFTRISRVDGAGRTTSAHDDKLFSLTNTHVNNINLTTFYLFNICLA